MYATEYQKNSKWRSVGLLRYYSIYTLNNNFILNLRMIKMMLLET